MIENHQLSRKVVPGILNAINTISEQVQLFVTRLHFLWPGHPSNG